MLQVSFRRLFRNDELCIKSAGSSEKLKTNKGREFEILGIGRYFDKHPNLNALTYGE